MSTNRRPSVAMRVSTPTGLYRRAVDLLGDAGVTDLTTLIGYYTTVSLTLAAYNVPADAVGLKR
jgi:4-carboxymuconolactone decarboxylase